MRRKLLLLSCALIIVVGSAHAQLAGSELFGDNENKKPATQFKKHRFGLDLGVGSVKNSEGTTFDLGLRWLYNFNPYIGWDIIGAKAIANSTGISETVTPQIMSGIRATSPTIFSNMSFYTGFRVGYGHNIEGDIGGMCYEISLGFNLTKNVFIGYAYNYQGGSKEEEIEITSGKQKYTKLVEIKVNQKYHAFRLGFNF